MANGEALGRTGAMGIAVLALLLGGLIGYVAGGGLSGPDVSESGRTSYACALAEELHRTHPTPDDWGGIGKDPAWNVLDAVPGLLGIAAPVEEDDSPFARMDWYVSDPTDLQHPADSVERVVELCAER